MTLDPKELELFEQSVVALNKLNVEVARLRSDVARLWARIEPFEDEATKAYEPFNDPKPKTFRDVLDTFEKVRKSLVNSQMTIGLVEARINQIHNDSWSREDMKPWLKGADK